MAGLYPEHIVQDVISANNIVDVISSYVRLKKTGRDYMGLCPFHGEKSPSFHVSEEKQLYHCFGCGAGGSLITFIMEMEHLDFVSALSALADRAGIVLPESDNVGASQQVYDKKQAVLKMNKLAARFFYDNLSTNAGESALRYLKERQLTNKTINNFGLGYAYYEKDSLIKHLKSNGYAIEDIVEAGLAVSRDSGIIDKFRDRVMFPIIDVKGDVIAFGGRVMGDGAPKYLNSPDTVVFNKSRNLFGLNIAKAYKGSTMILGEGYMDVIALHQAGLQNSVATLGTALTEDQSKILSRYCKSVCICYDSDDAGKKAALRGIDVLQSNNVKCKVITLSGAKDPDEYIKKYGVDTFKKCMNDALSGITYKVKILESQYNLYNIDDKIAFLDEIAKILSVLDNEIELETYVNSICLENDISQVALYSQVKKHRAKHSKKFDNIKISDRTINKISNTSVNTDGEQTSMSLSGRLLSAQNMLLYLLVRSRAQYLFIKELITPDDFFGQLYNKAAKLIYELYEKNNSVSTAMIISQFDEAESKILSGIFYNDTPISDYKIAVRHATLTIREEKLEMLIKNAADLTQKSKLAKELMMVQQERKVDK